MYLRDCDSVIITATRISGNTATQGGGGIFSQSSVVTLAESSLVGNDAGTNGGGGGIIQVGDTAMLVIDSSLIAGNRAVLEGAASTRPSEGA